MRILLVEDERRLADFLVKGLHELGHVVDVARDGVAGRRLALGGEYDLLILDVMLPGIDGLSILEAVRKAAGDCARTPVLMLTARDEIPDRVRGLEAGADDYLVKPFAVSELFARIGALSRRLVVKGTGSPVSVLRLADLEVDLIARRAVRSGQRLDLTGKEFALLAALLRRRGQILTRTAIAEQVWDMHFDSHTNIVEVAIRRLRSKLDDPFRPKLLHTERGMGYVIEDRSA
ncbi:MAG: heavy metal response regulator transcription factor [Hydrogenophaga sp.]|nr:heavy metal response regulator transcription factor [Hydrogenophaga sp.]